MDKPPVEPVPPAVTAEDAEALARLAELDDAELDALETNLRGTYEQFADDRTDEGIAVQTQVADGVDAVRAERERRAQALAQADAQAADIAARLNPPAEPDAPVEPDVPVEPEPAAEPEAKAASARPPLAKVRARMPVIRAPQRDATPQRASVAMLAAANVTGAGRDEELDDDRLNQALADRINRVLGSNWSGAQEKMSVARGRYDLPDENSIRGMGPEAASDVIRTLVRDRTSALRKVLASPTPMAARVAAGGLCAPLMPVYDVFTMGTDARPVRDGLVTIDGGRGGIAFISGTTLAAVVEGVTTITNAQDDTGGYTKPKQVVDCDTLVECKVDMVTAILQFGNLGSRAYPEQVAAYRETIGVAHAREAESRLLASMSTGSIAATYNHGTATLGAAREFTASLRLAAWGYRTRARMAANDPLEAFVPISLAEMWAADIALESPGRYNDPLTVALSEIEAAFRAASVVPTFYLDSATGGTSQISATQGAGALNSFPATTVWWLFAPGTWGFVDGGSLDLGIVRDSTLNSTNDFQIFMETFEKACKLGTESIQVTSTICASGAGALGVTAACV